MNMSHVFISYVRENAADVDRLRTEMVSRGIRVWVDREQIVPGERWKIAIRQAIENGAFFIACFSNAYADRSRTYMNEEILIAIEQLRLRPFDRSWFIPVLLSDVPVPDLPIRPSETLRDLQNVRLYDDWNGGIAEIVGAITLRRERTGNVVLGTALVEKFVALIDVVGYTSLVATNPEKLAKVLATFTETTQHAAEIFRIDTVRTFSDIVLIVSGVVPAGIYCTLDMMRRFAALTSQRSDFAAAVRAGGSFGPIVVHKNGVFGSAVEEAAQLAFRALPQQLLVAEPVTRQLSEKRLVIRPVGDVNTRGFKKPVKLFEVKENQ